MSMGREPTERERADLDMAAEIVRDILGVTESELFGAARYRAPAQARRWVIYLGDTVFDIPGTAIAGYLGSTSAHVSNVRSEFAHTTLPPGLVEAAARVRARLAERRAPTDGELATMAKAEELEAVAARYERVALRLRQAAEEIKGAENARVV